ncbi:MAG TPA: hypothetical protein VHM30_01205 [Gemmatimonadaceae bacterium]|nr:hypothetical protein [Gemmatimonadaceae bacterium]
MSASTAIPMARVRPRVVASSSARRTTSAYATPESPPYVVTRGS